MFVTGHAGLRGDYYRRTGALAAGRDRDTLGKKAAALSSGGVILCEACSIDITAKYGDHVMRVIECHHRAPLAEGKRTTLLADLALVCPTCHRYLHTRRPWLPVEELAGRLKHS